MASFLYRYVGKPACSAPSSNPLRDVNRNQQFAKEMGWMESTGISTGWADGTYRLLQPVKRDAMAGSSTATTRSSDASGVASQNA